MAESPDPFVKLKEQINCPVCLDVLTKPKLLSCTHAFCMNCIDHLPVDGDYKIYCPTCREPTTLPRNGSVASLRPAFLVNTLIELHHTALKLPVAVADEPKDKKCLRHDRPLEMYCDDCQQVVCGKCFIANHRDHNCDYISDLFDKQRQQIDDHLEPLKQHLSLVHDALHDLDTLHEHITTHGESVKNQIDVLIDQLVQAIKHSGATLKQNVDTLVQHKLNNISQKKEEGDIFLTLLKSCEQYIQDKLRNGSQQEILLQKNEMIKRLRVVSQQLTLQQLQLKEKADVMFQHSHDILQKCSKIGEVSIDDIVTDTKTLGSATVSNSHSQYKPLVKLNSVVAIVNRHGNVDIKVPNVNRLKRGSLFCHLVADVGGVSTQCEIKHVEKEIYRVSFTATHQGLHYIKVTGVDIACDLVTIQVATCIPIKKVQYPVAIATTSGLLLVAGKTRIALVNKQGFVIRHSNSQGGGNNTGICITPDNHILVVSHSAPHITKYTMECALVTNCHFDGPLQFDCPQGIAVCTSGHIYVCDTYNHCIQVLNSDLKFSRIIGGRGDGPVQFSSPRGIAIDSQDTVYVCDRGNKRIQKLSSSGMYISEFKLPSYPRYIAIDYNVQYMTLYN